MNIGSYDEANELLGQASKKALPGVRTLLVEIGHDPLTGVETDDDPPLAIFYHDTPCVIYLSDDSVVYYTGQAGLSPTTGQRMRAYGKDGVGIFTGQTSTNVNVGDHRASFTPGQYARVMPTGQILVGEAPESLTSLRPPTTLPPVKL